MRTLQMLFDRGRFPQRVPRARIRGLPCLDVAVYAKPHVTCGYKVLAIAKGRGTTGQHCNSTRARVQTLLCPDNPY